MKNKGILLAISSLPGKYGIGDFSLEAYKFIDIIKDKSFSIWQILPLNPVGYGHSPYQPYSSYAFDEIYISLEDLSKRGLINIKKYKKVKASYFSNFELARSIKERAIYEAYESFIKNESNKPLLEKFLNENPLVAEFVEFITLKEFNNSESWNNWKIFKEDRLEDFNYLRNKHGFAQMILFEEWNAIKDYANKNGIKIMGDIPFYVGYDSSDVYFHKESFNLDEKYNPTELAGVPPDYFSKDGQRWGNPIYNWDYLYQNDFVTLNNRIFAASKLYDIIRLDHFRAFDSYWAINPNCPTAVDGCWKYPDGYAFFDQLFNKYPNLNIVAEDLGELRNEVLYLRDHYNLPGMRVLEFSIFEDELENRKNEIENQIYYIGTHDNETLNEWILKQDKKNIVKLNNRLKELNIKGINLHHKLINYALKRKESIVIISASDILNLDARYRMNKPGIIDTKNWTFKLNNFFKLKLKLSK